MNKQEFIDLIVSERFPVLKKLLELPSDTPPKNNNIQLFVTSNARVMGQEPDNDDLQLLVNRVCENMTDCLLLGKKGSISLANGQEAKTMGGVLKKGQTFSYDTMEGITPFLEVELQGSTLSVKFSVDSEEPGRFDNSEPQPWPATTKENCLCLTCEHSLVARGKNQVSSYCTALKSDWPVYIASTSSDYIQGPVPDVQECNKFEAKAILVVGEKKNAQ
jgi:hypothetical protein